MQDSRAVAHGLSEIAALLRFVGQPVFKVQAYERGAEVVRTLGEDLAAQVERDGLRDLQGIGAALSRQIHELWNTGSSPLLERLRQETPEGAAELMQLPGMTPRRIRLLSEALGVKSVESLGAACAEQRVRAVPGFGEKTEQKLLDACAHFRERQDSEPEPLLLSRAQAVLEQLRERLTAVGLPSYAAGGVRRGEETQLALDLVVGGELQHSLSELSKSRAVLRTDMQTGTLYLGNGVTVTVHATAAARLGNVLHEATGNAEHVAMVARRAAEQGVAPSAEFPSEEALYSAVGLPYVPPELRFGGTELQEAAQRGFAQLLHGSSIRGMVHCHTTFSDGKHSVLEMAQAAHALGMQYITITDHSPSAHYASGVTLDRLKQQWDEIAAASEQVPIRILRGTESDILRDGSLDYPDSILEQLDVVIASIHARHRLTPEEMTERLVRALSLPFFKIWGHGLGRILNQRPPIACDVPRVLDALALGGGAVELNADPHRLDLPPEWIPAARERGLPFVVSVDAHSTRGFDVLPLGVTMARRGGLISSEVLNTLPPDEFVQRVKPAAGSKQG